MAARVRNHQVVEHWYVGKEAYSHTQSLHTDGEKLYSYALLIGDTTAEGDKILRDYTAKGTHGFRSQTTSCHVGLARRFADHIS